MIPYEWRKDPNAYQYFYKFSSTENSVPEEHHECVICMNKIIYHVDSDGNLINDKATEMHPVSSSSQPTDTNASQRENSDNLSEE